jgi:hypothetical protein
MKNLLLIALLLFTITTSVYSQDYVLKDNVFTVSLQSGVGVKIKVNFNIDQKTVDTLMKYPAFINWDTSTYNNPVKNADYIEKHKSYSHFENYLNTLTVMAGIWAQIDLKSYKSYTPILDSYGTIRMTKKGEISVTHSFQAQNGYGYPVTLTGFYFIKWVDGKEVERHFVYQ